MNPTAVRRPKQLKLPFDSPPKPTEQMLGDLIQRMTRLESRLVQLMKHQGMTTDGRAPLPASKEN